MTSSGHAHADMACRVTRVRALNVAENVRDLSCTRRTVQENDFELILTVKIETKHFVEGYSGSALRAIGRSVISCEFLVR